MAQVKVVSYWEDGYGIRHEVDKMSNDYVMNCICFLQKRRERLDRVEFDVKSINDEINACAQSIEMFADELERREQIGLVIERRDGCEGQNREGHRR